MRLTSSATPRSQPIAGLQCCAVMVAARMKCLTFLLLVTLAFAQAPDSVSGLIFRLRSLPIPVGPINNSFVDNYAVLLSGDGTYAELYSIRWAFRQMPQWSYLEPKSGTYTYKKLSTTSVTLTLFPEGGQNPPRSYPLTFTSAVAAAEWSERKVNQLAAPHASSQSGRPLW